MTDEEQIAIIRNPKCPDGWKYSAHFWDDCPMCGRMVVCGKCGNNSCNAGYGVLANGKDCDACPDAYEMQTRGE